MQSIAISERGSEYPIAFVVESEDELRLLYLSLNLGYDGLKGTDMISKPKDSQDTYHSMWEFAKMALVMRGLRVK